MIIRRLEARDYRNYASLDITLSEECNLLIGENGVGKTNLLEALGYLLCAQSIFGARDRDVIAFDKTSTYLSGFLEEGEEERKIFLSEEKKDLFRDGEKIKRRREFLLGTAYVLFRPVDLNLIKLSPKHRRDYLDEALSHINPYYERTLLTYKKVLEERNAFLKEERKRGDEILLDVYDEQLVRLAEELIEARLRAISRLSKRARDIYAHMSGEREVLGMKYLSSLPFSFDGGKNKEAFLRALKERRGEDLVRRQTTLGPHRDDIAFTLGGHDARRFASQGQQRSLLLSMKLAEVDLIEEERHIKPILLLDDVFSELDKKRKEALLENLEKTQSVITMAEAIPEVNQRAKGRFLITKEHIEEI